jgi:hypothetical protein
MPRRAHVVGPVVATVDGAAAAVGLEEAAAVGSVGAAGTAASVEPDAPASMGEARASGAAADRGDGATDGDPSGPEDVSDWSWPRAGTGVEGADSADRLEPMTGWRSTAEEDSTAPRHAQAQIPRQQQARHASHA